ICQISAAADAEKFRLPMSGSDPVRVTADRTGSGHFCLLPASPFVHHPKTLPVELRFRPWKYLMTASKNNSTIGVSSPEHQLSNFSNNEINCRGQG
ncbi:MAG: hypothetical protein LBJ20_03610, partial [Candidatus Methanoplasma sp.]|nr:hypothetical protein [Candidatus Methanoplasma sp.]